VQGKAPEESSHLAVTASWDMGIPQPPKSKKGFEKRKVTSRGELENHKKKMRKG